MSFLENKIPPPVILIVCLVLMWLISRETASLEIDSEVKLLASSFMFLLGVCIAVAGIVSFRKAKTTVNPLKPEEATHLVVVGVFKYTRNPMYLGMLCVTIGMVINLANLWASVMVLAFYLYISQYQIAPEERAMQKLFGDQFAGYTKRVRRWL